MTSKPNRKNKTLTSQKTKIQPPNTLQQPDELVDTSDNPTTQLSIDNAKPQLFGIRIYPISEKGESFRPFWFRQTFFANKDEAVRFASHNRLFELHDARIRKTRLSNP